jgi:regulator of nucleoside diphosphate kinase
VPAGERTFRVERIVHQPESAGDLRDATVVRADEVPADVVTMGSRFCFTDRRTGVSETYRLVYPDDADLGRDRLSVFAPIGTAVLGRRARQTVWWQVPWGLRVVRIEEVPFQPEAHGDRAADRGDDHAGDAPFDSGEVGVGADASSRVNPPGVNHG